MGQAIPPELRTWWQWHDGVQRVGEGTYGPESIMGPRWDFLSSTEAVKDRQQQLDWGNYWWEPSWLTVGRQDANALFVDCRDVTEVGTVPVRGYDHTPDDVFTPRAGCFTAAVTLWTELIEQGIYHWVDGHPTFEPAMPPRIHRLLQIFGPL
jgi:cell wall assembly regulator SMI1